MSDRVLDKEGRSAAYLRRLRALVSDERGFTPAQMIVSILAYAILAGSAAFGVHSVISWQQDNAAQSELDVVVEDQNRRAGSGDPYSSGVSGITASATSMSGGCYTAIALSSTGRVFYADSVDKTKEGLSSDTTVGCVAESQLQQMMDDIGVSQSTIEARSSTERLNYTGNITTQPVDIGAGGAGTWSLGWDAVDHASGYEIYSVEGGSETLIDTVPAGHFPTMEFDAEFGGGETFRIVAVGDGYLSSHPVTYGFSTLPDVVTNGSFERGFLGWEVGRVHTDEDDENPRFETDDRVYAGTVRPTEGEGNTSRAVAEVRKDEAIRSEPFELTDGDEAHVSFDARLRASGGWMVEFFDEDMERVEEANRTSSVTPRSGEEEAPWLRHDPDNTDANPFTAPEGAEYGRLVLIGSGTTAETAAQFDNVDITYHQ